MSNKIYFIQRVLNNNSILTLDKQQNTSILIGKGIGFSQKSNTYVEIDESKIEKSFYNYDETLKTQLIDMINNFDEDIIEVSNKIIALAEAKLSELNQHVYISLSDHISFALDRIKENKIIANPFFEQIQVLLVEEYQIALKARKIIYDKFKIVIPDEEVGFIAFHLNAARENIKVNYVVQEVRIYKELLRIFEEDFNIVLDSVKCSDLYLIIQTFVKKEKLPLQFLIEDINPNVYLYNTRKHSMLQKCIKYIEGNNNLILTNTQKFVLSAFIKNINKEGNGNE